MIQHIRRRIYKMGIRPKPGSFWYSPSLSWVYAFKDSKYAENFEKAVNRKF